MQIIKNNIFSILLVLAISFMVVLSFPYWNFFLLSFTALVPLFFISKRKYPFFWGWLSGFFTFIGLTYWLTNAIHEFGEIPLFLAFFALLILAAYFGLYYGCFSLIISRINSKLVPFIAPFIWVALEYFRAKMLTGIPIAILGYSQASFLGLIQVADIAGVYGVSFIIVFVNGMIFKIAEPDGRLLRDKIKAYMPALILVLFATLAYGKYRLDSFEVGGGDLLPIGIIQGNIPQSEKWDKAHRMKTVTKYKLMSREAADKGAKLIVWPESSMPFLFFQQQQINDDLLKYSKSLGADILLGAPTIKDRTEDEYFLYNSAVLLSDRGRVAGKYDKVHLVPFGEYVPLKSILFFIKRLVFAAGEFVPGDGHYTLNKEKTAFGVLVCYEMIFPEPVREYVRNGAKFLVVITNDAWYGNTTAPHQLFNIGIFRAIESRLPLVRSANSGVSGFVDSTGRVISSGGVFTDVVLVENVYLGDGKMTFYSRYGDLFAIASVIVLIFALILIAYRLRNENNV